MTLLPIHFDCYTTSSGQEGFENHPAPSSLTMNSGWTRLSHFTITCHAFSKSAITSWSINLRAFLNDWSLHVPSFVNSFYFFQNLHSVQSISFTCHALANAHQCIVMSMSMTGRRFGTAFGHSRSTVSVTLAQIALFHTNVLRSWLL